MPAERIDDDLSPAEIERLGKEHKERGDTSTVKALIELMRQREAEQARRQSEREALVGADEMAERIAESACEVFIDSELWAAQRPPGSPADLSQQKRIAERREKKASEVMSLIATALSPLYAKLARQAALLAECRYSVKAELELLAPIDGGSRVDELTDRMNRIDAEVVGKGREGSDGLF